MITLNIATYKAREESLKKMLPSVSSQRFKFQFNLYLNDYFAPKWLKKWAGEQPFKVNIVSGKSKGNTDLKAAAKFYFTKECPGFYVMADDDLYLAPDYVGYSVHSLCKYIGAFIGYHARVYKRNPIEHYNNTKIRRFEWHEGTAQDELVDVLGTGQSAFINDGTLTVDYFKGYEIATDPRMAEYCRENGIPMLTMTKADNWTKPVENSQHVAIWKDVANSDCWLQTKCINRMLQHPKPSMPFPATWQNSAMLESHLIDIVSEIQKGEFVCEFGSGQSSKVLRRASHWFRTYEHNPVFSDGTNFRPINSATGWYDINSNDLKVINEADIVIIDGPNANPHGWRYNIPSYLCFDRARIIYIDDVHREKDLKQAEQLAKRLDMSIEILPGATKQMAKLKRNGN
jgi:hypothetical protein